MDAALTKLDTVSPINSPSTQGRDNKQFLKEVQAKLADANRLRDCLETMKNDLGKNRDRLVSIVQPLSELGEREVTQPEIEKILASLKALNVELANKEKDFAPRKAEVDALVADVDHMLEKAKGRKIDEAQDLLNQLDGQIEDLGLRKNKGA